VTCEKQTRAACEQRSSGGLPTRIIDEIVRMEVRNNFPTHTEIGMIIQRAQASSSVTL